jgi:hypothetical protein
MTTLTYTVTTVKGNKTITETKTAKVNEVTSIAIDMFKKVIRTEARVKILEAALWNWVAQIPSEDMDAYTNITDQMAEEQEAKTEKRLK